MSSLITTIKLIFLGLLTMFVPRAHYRGSDNSPSVFNQHQAIMLGVFLGLQVVAFVLIFCFVPETAKCTGRNPENGLDHLSLEELNYLFQEQPRDFAKYRRQIVLPRFRERTKWYMWDRFKDPKPRKPPRPIVVWKWRAERNEQQDGSGSDTEPPAEQVRQAPEGLGDRAETTQEVTNAALARGTNSDHEMRMLRRSGTEPPRVDTVIPSSSLRDMSPNRLMPLSVPASSVNSRPAAVTRKYY